MTFTDQQRAAIDHTEGNLQLIACAGSGKTEVVARRIAGLLKSGVRPSGVIAFTFTEKAAAELKDRIVTRCRELLGNITGLAELYVGTIHAFCLDLLMTEVHEMLKYDVLNEVQQTLFIDRHSKESGLTTCRDRNGRMLRRYVDTSYYLSALNTIREDSPISSVLNSSPIYAALSTYRQLLTKKRHLDYSEILAQALHELRTNSSLREHLKQRVRHLVVDEYQDVNPIQEAIVNELHSLGAALCVVGDDDQTIYQWRGSEVENILTFDSRYGRVAQIRLEENFRSSEGIVETARTFIEQNQARLPKRMKSTTAQPFETGDICALQFDDPDAEAEHIATTVASLHGIAFNDVPTDSKSKERGLAWSDMAILLRSVARNGQPVTAALQRHGIPYVVVGMNTLFNTAEAQAAREVFYFVGGTPGATRQTLLKAWQNANVGTTHEEIIRAIDEIEAAKAAMENPRERYGFYSIQRSFLRFIETAGIREERVPNNCGEVMFYNLGKFSQVISDFETINYHSQPKEKYKSFADFLKHHAEDAYPEGAQSNQYANPNAVRVMTVHQAKGMQWPVVFVPALIKNRFPSPALGGRSQWHILSPSAIPNQARYRGSVEDERRLFYVAITRSQKFLHLTYAPVPSNQRFQSASEFLIDVYASKFVKRRPVDYSARRRLTATPRRGLSNVVFSFSDLKYFFECPYQFKLRILYGFNAPIHEALGYGRSLHNALAEVHRRALDGDVVDQSAAGSLTTRHLNAPYAYKALRDKLEEAAKDVIERYIAENDLQNIEFSEKQIEITLDDAVSVVGRIDLVRRIDTGETTIVDLKSSERAQEEDVTETQLHIYALGYRELTGRDADKVEIYELDEGKKKPRAVDQDFIADVRNEVNRAATVLRSGSLSADPGPRKCSNCDYLRMCTAGIAVVEQSG
jgi:DNA helicase-2/ATP-dependent DNA helicase PcrA